MTFFNLEEHKPSARRVYHVSEITREIRVHLEERFPDVRVDGEISNFKAHSSGHYYFTLKDAGAQLGCVMWRGRNQTLRFRPKDGMQIIAQGAITLYEKSGRYQLDVAFMQPAGMGDLQMAFEALKQKLDAEGLFDSDLKKPLPFLPQRIGVVTSPTGAALQDIISVIKRRYSGVELVVFPVRVQGEGAAEEIISAIDLANTAEAADVLIVGRGGGSLEDLWAFNEEIVARAIFRSDIPVISAVGHEIDFTISDFVADVRAPTPSAGAELVVPDKQDLSYTLSIFRQRMENVLNMTLTSCRERLSGFENRYTFRQPEAMVREYRFRLDDLERQIRSHVEHRMSDTGMKLDYLQAKLYALHPDQVLKRGFSIVRKQSDNQIVTETSQLQPEDNLDIRFAKGKVAARVNMILEP